MPAVNIIAKVLVVLELFIIYFRNDIAVGVEQDVRHLVKVLLYISIYWEIAPLTLIVTLIGANNDALKGLHYEFNDNIGPQGYNMSMHS